MQEICTCEAHKHQQAADEAAAAQLAAQKEENWQLAAQLQQLEKKNKLHKLASHDAVNTRHSAKMQSGNASEKK